MRVKTWLVVGAFILLTGGLQLSAFAAPEGGRGFDRDGRGEIHEGFAGGLRGGFYGGWFPRRAFVGPGFGFGWGWDYPGFWGPYYYPGPNVVELHHVDYGTVEFKVKPDTTKVYVDQKFIGMVKDLDHHKAFMKAGNHEIKLESPDGQTLDRTLYVAAGQKIKIDESL